jgi:CRP-like cAMP-binding protein
MVQYRTRDLIYFKGDIADKVLILTRGTVSLVTQNPETGDDQYETVQNGQFFGVKSAIGRYPREENAIALQDAAVLAFTVPEFEALIAANPAVLMKMLKVFSNQLRHVDRQIHKLMKKEEQLDAESGLFYIGEYYLKAKKLSHAGHVFKRYLVCYPQGKYLSLAEKYLSLTEGALRSGQ